MKKIALIGIGKMGMSHLAIANMTSGLDIVAVCDTSKILLKFVNKNMNFKTYTDYKKMITEMDLDGIMILVPNAFHYDLAKYCIQKGIHLFIEKPFTLSYNESQELVDLAKMNNVKGQVGYVNRFNPVFEKLKKLLDSEVIGNISNYTNRMTGGVILKDNKGWRNDYNKGGGCLFDYGPHCFDLATYLFSSDVKVLSSVLKKIYSTNVDDVVYSTLLHKNSIVGINYINWSDSSVRKATNSIEIMGSKGKLSATKYEINIFLNEENQSLGFEKGWNQMYVTNESTNVEYYLRGEDFSRQLSEFSSLINNNIEESRSSLFTASITDMLLENTKSLAGELI